MTSPQDRAGSSLLHRSGSSPWLFPVLLVLAGALAYGNSLGGLFVFDDNPSIVGNASLRSVFRALFPPDDLTVSGRPVLNLSFALNRLFGDFDPAGYHVVNLLIHLASGLVLFDLVRRVLSLPRFGGRFAGAAGTLAFAAALLWIVHPLGTEAVTYVVQRAESLAAFFLLFCLYALLRGWLRWAIAACFLAMGTKETAAGLPLLAFLFDRTFLAGTFAGAWAARRRFYLFLAAAWVLLAVPFLWHHGRGASAGLVREGIFHTGLFANVDPWTYALTQAKAILLYLRLAFRPAPLVFDYGYEVVPNLAVAWPFVLGVLILLGATLWAVARRPAAGFLGALAFAVLAPSSSFFPIQTQTMAEHRFYLPLAAVAVGVVLALDAVLRKERAVLLVALLAAVPLGFATWHRNLDYRTPLALWADTAAKRPGNPRAQCNLGTELAAGGDDLQAIFRFRRAIRLRPDFGEAHTKLGSALYHTDHVAEGMEEMAAAVDLTPMDPLSQSNYGAALQENGHLAQGIGHLAQAVALAPNNATYHYNLGNAWNKVGKVDEAIAEFDAAIELKPDYVEAHNNLGIAYYRQGNRSEARLEFEKALRIDPTSDEARRNLAHLRELRGGP